jgi:hypothetical protein
MPACHLPIQRPKHRHVLSLDYFVELRRGVTIKQWPHTLPGFVMRRTAMHR